MTSAQDRLAAMDAALSRIEQIGQVASLDPGDVSFGLLPFDLSAYWDETVGRFRTLVDRLSQFAVAESSIESGVQARSVIGWTGDLATVWSGPLSSDQRRAHFLVLDADIRYRARLILILSASVRTAASLCAAAASPWMAPAALRSVKKLVEELQSLSQPAERD